jgi:hypothetical protein
MTPSLSLILFVALFWTLPASAAALAYRRYDGSIKDLKASLRVWLDGADAERCPDGRSESRPRRVARRPDGRPLAERFVR